jgi:hypothetical protein
MLRSPLRLDGPDAVVCDWRSVADQDKESREDHLRFEGLRVEGINLIKPGNDLEVRLSRGIACECCVIRREKPTTAGTFYVLTTAASPHARLSTDLGASDALANWSAAGGLSVNSNLGGCRDREASPTD